MAGGRTVLVVDDEPSIRLLCRVNLELDGFEVLEAASIAEARARVDAGEADVVLLDVHVGSDNGLDFLDELKREWPALPVALLTGSTNPIDTAADALIPKPFALDQLVGTVHDLARPCAPGPT